MASFMPSTLHEIRRAGYKLLQRRACNRCGQTIEHWSTTHGKDIYFNPMSGEKDESVPHRSTCKAVLKERAMREQQSNPLHRFAASQHAAVAIVVNSECLADWSLANNCLADPAELHASIVSAADAIRDRLVEMFSTEPQ